MCPRERFSYYKSLFQLVLCYKRIGPPCCTLFTFVTCFSLQFILSQNYLLPLISVLAENTLLKTAYHFLLLLVGFNTLTYQKDYDRSAIIVGHQGRVSGAIRGPSTFFGSSDGFGRDRSNFQVFGCAVFGPDFA